MLSGRVWNIHIEEIYNMHTEILGFLEENGLVHGMAKGSGTVRKLQIL